MACLLHRIYLLSATHPRGSGAYKFFTDDPVAPAGTDTACAPILTFVKALQDVRRES